MKPVKGGLLAKAPADADALLESLQPKKSFTSCALRFVAESDGVLAILSGMSNLEQFLDNISTIREYEPLSTDEEKIIRQCSQIYRENGSAGTAGFSEYDAINPKGISAAAVLETWNNCTIQPVPSFAAEHNYFITEKSKYHIPMNESCLSKKIVGKDGTDITAITQETKNFLMTHGFFKYEI